MLNKAVEVLKLRLIETVFKARLVMDVETWVLLAAPKSKGKQIEWTSNSYFECVDQFENQFEDHFEASTPPRATPRAFELSKLVRSNTLPKLFAHRSELFTFKHLILKDETLVFRRNDFPNSPP